MLKLQSAIQKSLRPIYSVFGAFSLSKSSQSSVLSPHHLCFLLIALLISLCSMPLTAAYAAQVELAWDPSSGTVTGYTAHYGTSSGEYDYSVNVGNNTSCTISGLTEGETYYYAVTAYNAESESDFSDELAYMIPLEDSGGGGTGNTPNIVIEAEDMSYHANAGAPEGAYWVLYAAGSNSEIIEDVYFPDSGTYNIEITAKGDLAFGVGPEMQLRIDGQSKGTVFVNTNTPNIYSFQVDVSAGTHEVTISFTNDYYNPATGVDRNLYVDKISFYLQ